MCGVWGEIKKYKIYMENPVKIKLLDASEDKKNFLTRKVEELLFHINPVFGCSYCIKLYAGTGNEEIRKMWEEPCPMKKRINIHKYELVHPERIDQMDIEEDEKQALKKEIEQLRFHWSVCKECGDIILK